MLTNKGLLEALAQAQRGLLSFAQKPTNSVVVSDETRDTWVLRLSFASVFQRQPSRSSHHRRGTWPRLHREMGLRAGSMAGPPVPPRLEQLGWFRRQRGAGPPHTCNNGVPLQPVGPRFHLSPRRVAWRQPSPLQLAPGTQQRHAGVAPGLQAAKPNWDLGGQPTDPSTTGLTCRDACWPPGHLHVNHHLRPSCQHCHRELQAQRAPSCPPAPTLHPPDNAARGFRAAYC